MGLLDEAIREHLNLRRRHGADPEEIAREELDALAPVERDQRPERWSVSATASAGNETGDEVRRRAPLGEQQERIVGKDTGGWDRRSPEANFIDETAEIDMRAVLGELEDAMSSEETGDDARVRRAIRAESAAPVAATSSNSAFDFEVDEDPPALETLVPRVHRVERRTSERTVCRESSPEASGS